MCIKYSITEILHQAWQAHQYSINNMQVNSVQIVLHDEDGVLTIPIWTASKLHDQDIYASLETVLHKHVLHQLLLILEQMDALNLVKLWVWLTCEK
jgi:hypothetical protein